jgi:hypothetical protein
MIREMLVACCVIASAAACGDRASQKSNPPSQRDTAAQTAGLIVMPNATNVTPSQKYDPGVSYELSEAYPRQSR